MRNRETPRSPALPWLASAAVGAAILAAAPGGAAEPVGGTAILDMTVAGVASAEGTVRVDLYDRAEGFRDPDRARLRTAVEAIPGAVRVRVTDLNPGSYAVIVYHDEDNDGELDRFLGMIPTEGYGVSNNPVLSGPPSFDAAAVTLPTGETRLVIDMRY